MKKTLAILTVLICLGVARAAGDETLSGALRFRTESFHNYNLYDKIRASEGNREVLNLVRADITGQRRWGPDTTGLLELRAGAASGFSNADAAFRPGDFVRVRQAWVETGNTVKFRLGRQELDLDRGIITGGNDWLNAGHSLDGIRMTLPHREWTLDAFAAYVSDPSTSFRDGVFAGFRARHTSSARTIRDLDLYFRSHPKSLQGDSIDMSTYTLGVRQEGKLSERLFYHVMAHVQRGRTTAYEPRPAPALRQKIKAHHILANLDCFVHDRVVRNLGIEYSTGSGDDAGTPETAETFQQLFPVSHQRFGSFDWFGLMNADILTLYAFYDISPRVNGLIQYHRFRLNSSGSAWYVSDGRAAWTSAAGDLWPNSSSSARDAGSEWDFEWRIRSGPSTYHLGYSIFNPGNAFANPLQWNTSATARWAYFQVNIDL